MEKIDFRERFSGIEVSGDWHFRKEYPSILSKTDSEKERIFLSEEKLKIPVGKKKIAVRFFVWVKYKEVDDTYICRFGMVPDKSSIDDTAISVLNSLSNRKFVKNPYLYMLESVIYRYVFLTQEGVTDEDLDDVISCMFLASDHVEEHIVSYLYDNSPGMEKEEGLSDFENGWSVLARARSGSLG